jgi:hypothetical protein
MLQSPWIRLLAVSTLIVAPVLADEARKAALVEEILTLNKSEAMMQMILDQYRGVIQQQIQKTIDSDPQLQPYAKNVAPLVEDYENRLIEVLRKSLNWTDLKPKLVELYKGTFSEEELAAIVAFYKTEAGQSFLKKMPDLATRAMQLGQQQVQSAMPEIRRLNLELREKAAKIAADHAKQ